ncbi:hypothetical protein DXG01_007953 [Tephrocybe rancida]|nr:hypothetical protein DXG01_007953 [Tephrocybe rancida]
MPAEQLLQLRGGRIIAFEQGGDVSSSTILLMFHGAFAVGDASHPSPVLLEKKVRLVAPTLPGWGKSSPHTAGTPYHIGLADDISALLAHLFPPGEDTALEIHLAGGSFGTVAAQMLYGASFDVFPRGRRVRGCLLLAPFSPPRYHTDYASLKTMALANYIALGPPGQWVPFRLLQRLAVGVVRPHVSSPGGAEAFLRGELFGHMGAGERGAYEAWLEGTRRTEGEFIRDLAGVVVRSVDGGRGWAGFVGMSDVVYSDWGFRPDELDAEHTRGKMMIVASRGDRTTPVGMGMWLAGMYKGACVEVLDGGHAASLYYLDGILSRFLG